MRKWFTAKNIEELKKEYKILAKKWHPDLNNNSPESIKNMQEINNEFEILFNQLKGKKEADNKENAEEYIIIMQKVAHLNIQIELIGNWLWVTSGNTYAVKDVLKNAGFKWAGQKKMWYWHPDGYVKKTKKSYNIDEIRNMHGAKVLKNEKDMPNIGA